MSKNVLFKRKTIPIDDNFWLWKNITFNQANLKSFLVFVGGGQIE